ncbi:WxL domain-containing protein [Listeria seeligeri]|uniref:WxL domain-containing protein n=1 Tax=Listeria seeligeri TaxID=1640 RepID=UPI001627017B|nr:WxL domain-containing protein [Listeria seeligeri]MBC1577885.1 WxL domain-containing protein [Listeria seeligeri]MBC1586183.1 WxL domain-containing protein [Listeria seeligeri]MBC1596263.1 WxL domain-containing protein [Listeria seeligeri]MBC1599365.1 WxL domain-containing protein [Listeria seeligeri]MBC1731465.1 WxL domain-containing protein [Listeria seeligeri]
MKNKKVLALLTTFAVTALPVVTLVGTDVSADTTFSPNGLGATSDGTIIFEPNTTPVNPVNPDDDDPYVPDDNPVNPDDTNPLKIAYVSTLDFGTQAISSENKVYTANKVTLTNQLDSTTTKEINPAVTISDGRGTGAGWKLQVKQNSAFTNASSDTLEGAQLTLEKSGIYSNQSNTSVAPTGVASVDVNTSNANVLTAAANTGQGVWQEEMVGKLAVAGNTAKEGTYSTTLTWTLTDTPS